jgi:hypothetical protein
MPIFRRVLLFCVLALDYFPHFAELRAYFKISYRFVYEKKKGGISWIELAGPSLFTGIGEAYKLVYEGAKALLLHR